MDSILNYLENYKTKTFLKNETIFYENDECKLIGFVKAGEIKISSTVLNGNEIVYNVIKPGGMFGENLIFSSNKQFRGDVIATEKSEIIFLSKDELEKLMMTNKDFLELFLNTVSDFSKQLNLKLKLLTFNIARDRIMYYLDIMGGKISYKSITSLSEFLNLSRESLSRNLHQLIKEKVILIKDRTIVKLD